MIAFGRPRTRGAFTEETAMERLYPKREEPRVTNLRKLETVPEETVQRLVNASGLNNYTVAQIEERWASLRQAGSDENDGTAAAAEHHALDIIRAYQQAVDASAVSDEREIRLRIGELDENEAVTRQAIKLAAAAINHVDPEQLQTVYSWGRNRAELSAVDVTLRSPMDSSPSEEITGSHE